MCCGKCEKIIISRKVEFVFVEDGASAQLGGLMMRLKALLDHDRDLNRELDLGGCREAHGGRPPAVEACAADEASSEWSCSRRPCRPASRPASCLPVSNVYAALECDDDRDQDHLLDMDLGDKLTPSVGALCLDVLPVLATDTSVYDFEPEAFLLTDGEADEEEDGQVSVRTPTAPTGSPGPAVPQSLPAIPVVVKPNVLEANGTQDIQREGKKDVGYQDQSATINATDKYVLTHLTSERSGENMEGTGQPQVGSEKPDEQAMGLLQASDRPGYQDQSMTTKATDKHVLAHPACERVDESKNGLVQPRTKTEEHEEHAIAAIEIDCIAQEAARLAVSAGLTKALKMTGDGKGGQPICPRGHALRAVAVEADAACVICGTTACGLGVMVRCTAKKCFMTCAVNGGCAPTGVIAAFAALRHKHFGGDSSMRSSDAACRSEGMLSRASGLHVDDPAGGAKVSPGMAQPGGRR